MKEKEKIFFIAMLQEVDFKDYISCCHKNNRFATDVAESLGLNIKQVTYWLSKWCKKGFWDYGISLRSGWFEFDKLSGQYTDIYNEEIIKFKYDISTLSNEPVLGKNEPHGFDYTPITWQDFLKLREAARICADNIGYPVYLVGSALRKCVPRDIDISVIIPLNDYELMFGKLPTEQCDYAKYLQNVTYKTFDMLQELYFCLINTHHLDIKICPDTWWKEKDKMLLAEPKKGK